MRVGVIRGDLPGSLFLADLETVSETDFPIEPVGQTRYVSRPNATAIASYLASQGLAASATTLISTTVPVGGPVDVSSATIKGVAGLSGASNAQVAALQDLLAPKFLETDVVIESFQVGELSKLLSSHFTPDSTRLPALATGPAIAVVMDDGVTPFTAPLPTISSAVNGGGNLTISGTALGNSELYDATRVRAYNTALGVSHTATQRAIVHAGGSVGASSVVVPQSLLPGVAAGWSVQLEFTTLVSNVVIAT